ncbi:hypothetical protein MtrunA17_Chr8g0364971 [Medicago truncatula]|uniref:Uncharacterized protein n=1 Tax=Medicago truncatula TaxID=3880 RepID=A0A072TSZ8_MEDTR|nr:hypothetical protein MTR_8g063820 [Medicago truncatula]RHN41333.1 hypothetical protein MtrunA17_Chr8g0364971 [Medicago truncatula]
MWSPVIRLRVTRKGQLFIGRRVQNQIASSFHLILASRESCHFVCAYPQQMFESEIITRNAIAISRCLVFIEWNVLDVSSKPSSNSSLPTP